MDFLSNYMKLSYDERTQHVDLSTPCVLTGTRRSNHARFQLLLRFELVNDVEHWSRKPGVCLCHHCEHDSANGWCTNPLHLHLGTTQENYLMRPLDQRLEQARRGADTRAKLSYDSVVERMTGTVVAVDKNGNSIRLPVDEAKERQLPMTTSKAVQLLDEKTGELHFFQSLSHCADFLGVHTPAVTRAVKQNRCVHRHFRPTLLEP